MGSGEQFWHFDDASLPAEWSALSGNSGSVAMSDHGVLLTGGNTGYAAIVKAFDRSLGRYQRITACVRTSNNAFRLGLGLMYQAGGLTGDTLANQSPKFLARSYLYNSGSSYYGVLDYWDTAGAAQHWLDSSKAWSATNGASTPLLSADDYHIFGLDWDDVLDRVRLFWVHVASGSTFASESHGPKLFALTDWLDLASIQNGGQSSDLWLYIGWILAQTNTTGMTQHIEWVRHEWADELLWAVCNQKTYSSGNGYSTKLHTLLTPEGIKLPLARSGGVPVAPVASTWESSNAGQWGSIVYDPVAAKYWMSYAGTDGTNNAIGIASATDPLGTWTKYASNPILTDEAGVDYGGKLQSCLVLDYTDPDPARRWKLVVSCISRVDSKLRVYLYTAAQPDTTSWTRDGLVIDYDAGNADGDMGPELYAPPVYLGGRWYLFYVGLSSAAAFVCYVAVGDRLAAGAFAKNRTLDFEPRGDGVEMTITSGSSTSRTVTVDDTTGVRRDDFVMYDQDSSSANWRLGRVRKVISSTQLELYHLMPGLSTSGVLRTINHGKNYPTHLRPHGDRWLWYSTSFGSMFLHASFGSSYEGSSLYVSTDPPYSEKPTRDAFGTPGFWLTRDVATGDNGSGSMENPRFPTRPVHPFTQALTTHRRRRRVHLRR